MGIKITKNSLPRPVDFFRVTTHSCQSSATLSSTSRPNAAVLQALHRRHGNAELSCSQHDAALLFGSQKSLEFEVLDVLSGLEKQS